MRLKTILFLLGCTAVTLNAQTQQYQHLTCWMRGTISVPLSKKWEVVSEYVQRQQNEIGSKNPFSHEYLQQLTVWANYKMGNCTLIMYPFGYIHSTALLGKLSDYNAKPNVEWRFATALEWKQTLGKITFKERGQYEYRFLKSINYSPSQRMRLRGMVQYQLTKKMKLNLLEEYWFNVPPLKVPNHFDQNWVFLSLSEQLTTKWVWKWAIVTI